MGLLSKVINTVIQEVEDVIYVPYDRLAFDKQCLECKHGIRCVLLRAHNGDHVFKEVW